MIIPFVAIFVVGIGLATVVGLIKNYIFLFQQNSNTAVILISASLLSLLIPDSIKVLFFILISCVAMFIATSYRNNQKF